MQIPAANGPKRWSSLGSVTTVTRVFGPKVRAQNADPCGKWAKKMVKFRVCHDRDTFSWWRDKKSRTDPEMNQVKMQISAANGPKDARILLALSLAKQPPRGPFAHELRNQTGGNNYSNVTAIMLYTSALIVSKIPGMKHSFVNQDSGFCEFAFPLEKYWTVPCPSGLKHTGDATIIVIYLYQWIVGPTLATHAVGLWFWQWITIFCSLRRLVGEQCIVV